MPHPTVATRTCNLTARLREATAGVREDREILAGRVSWLDYRLYLVRMYGFYTAIERTLASSRQLSTVIADAALRNHKSALLAHDLIALGVDRSELAQFPRMTCAPALALPEALGWTYVVESMTLAGRQLMRHLARQLPDEIQVASAFLRCYGDVVQDRWRELGLALDAFEDADRDGDRVIEAAREGFLQLQAWVRPAMQPRPSRIHA
jgi:heme oxygenase